MDKYITMINKKNPITFEPFREFGPEILAISWEDAEDQCAKLNIPGCYVEGKLFGEMPEIGDTVEGWKVIEDDHKRFLN